MTAPIVEFNGDFSEPDTGPVPWAEVDAVLLKSEMFWLSTVRPDGRPHVTPIPAIWDAGKLHFCSGSQEQKSANLARNPQCVLTTGTNQLFSGLDVIAEGVAVRVTERPRLLELAALWKAQIDWDYEVGEHAFKDAIGRDGLVFAVAPVKVLSFSKKPYVQTRYRFS